MTKAESFLLPLRERLRSKRIQLFRALLPLDERTTILDLGSEDGSHIHQVISGTRVRPQNVTIADLDRSALEKGTSRYGFRNALLPELGTLPFGDGAFDIVYCSAVIEHVTLPKQEVWHVWSGREFRTRAFSNQSFFASEIRRVGKSYFVHTPNKHYPIETHSWIPLLGSLPRRLQCSILSVTNHIWIKPTDPDWNLLTKKEVTALFPGAKVLPERLLGITKAWIAVKIQSGVGLGSPDYERLERSAIV